MTDRPTGGLDAVERGPLPSDGSGGDSSAAASEGSDHPSVAALRARFGDAIEGDRVSAGDQTVVWIDPAKSLEILGWLKEDPGQQYDMMSDVTGVDYGGGRPVEVVYQMFSTVHKRALRVRCQLPLDALEIDSVVGLWAGANWLEREVYDLFGVTFKGHPDHRRILMPQDYAEGHPLRKDFPLRGRFSRAEQTRRALAQDVARFYGPEELIESGEPQEVSGHPAADSASTGAAGEASTPAQTEGEG
ncbi:MAG: NADH-quinone oxidoreductase subunit C [Gemmatimonadota bacterium]